MTKLSQRNAATVVIALKSYTCRGMWGRRQRADAAGEPEELHCSFCRKTAQEIRKLTHGIYARIRHPIYLFGCIAYIGALLALQVWPLLIAWVALTPIELVRVRREERILEARFGEEYRRYRSATWF